MMCVLALAVAAWAPGRPRAADGQAVAFQGVNVCGRVVDYGCDEETHTVLLKLDKKHGPGIMGFGIPAVQRPAFGERFEYQYLGAEVCGVGRIEQRDGDNVVMIATPESLAVHERAPWAAAPFARGAMQLCTSGVEAPVLTREVKPVYTQNAMRALIQGTVGLEAVVLPSGRVGEIRVLRSLDSADGLDREAIIAARQWRFRPGTLRGEPVPVIVRIDMTFKLQ
jgi:TonB family protein